MKKEPLKILTDCRKMAIAAAVLAVLCAVMAGLYIFNHISLAYVWEEYDSETYNQEIYGGGIVLKEYRGTAAHIRVPATIKGMPVRLIDDSCFSANNYLKTVELPDTLVFVPSFAYCENLEEIRLPEGIESIPWRTFVRCTSLRSIEIPDSVSFIGNSAFVSCHSLEEVIIPDSVTSIGKHAFAYCVSLEEVIIPESVTFIENDAFFECDELTVIAPHEPEFYSLSADLVADHIKSWVVKNSGEVS